ncbi:MAG: hypothetical protein QM536_03385 [Chitinophagaceae bacterium]|nr:hypothetical protein [Chitinophagaceae bacterium]
MKNILFLILISWGSISCERNTKTQTYSKNDTIFFDFTFGMRKQDFYNYCAEKNREKIFTHGPRNMEIEYTMTEIQPEVMMWFYPDFYEDRIYKMKVTYMYTPWAPWNTQYYADKLIIKILDIYKKKYGSNFQTVQTPNGTIHSQINGKRRINIRVKDEQYVEAFFTDMKIEKLIEKKENNLL